MILCIRSTWERNKTVMQTFNSYTFKIKYNIEFNKKLKCFSNSLKKTYVADISDNLAGEVGGWAEEFKHFNVKAVCLDST